MKILNIKKTGTLAVGMLLASNTYAGTCDVEFDNTLPNNPISIDTSGFTIFDLGFQNGETEAFLFDLSSGAQVTINHFGAPTDSVGRLWQDPDFDGTYEVLLSEADDVNGLQYAFDESLAEGAYCIETSAFNNAEAMPWTGSVELTVNIAGDTTPTRSFGTCLTEGVTEVTPPAWIREEETIDFFFGDSNNSISSSSFDGPFGRGQIIFDETFPQRNFHIARAVTDTSLQSVITQVPSGGTYTIPEAGEYCIYMERDQSEMNLSGFELQGNYSFVPEVDIYSTGFISTPSGNIILAENTQNTNLNISLTAPLIPAASSNELKEDWKLPVSVRVGAATATEGLDYNLALDNEEFIGSNLVLVNGGEISGVIDLQIIQDNIQESDEQLQLFFEVPSELNGYTGTERTLSIATITIQDDDAPSPVNRNPVASLGNIPVGEVGQLFQGSITASDVDGDSLSFTLEKPANGSATWLNIDNNGTLSGTPTTQGTITDLKVTVDDNNGGSDSVTFSIQVNPGTPESTNTGNTNNNTSNNLNPTTSNKTDGGGSLSIAVILAMLLLLAFANRNRQMN